MNNPPTPQPSIWQRRSAQTVLPAAASILLHLTVAVILVVKFQTLGTINSEDWTFAYHNHKAAPAAAIGKEERHMGSAGARPAVADASQLPADALGPPTLHHDLSDRLTTPSPAVWDRAPLIGLPTSRPAFGIWICGGCPSIPYVTDPIFHVPSNVQSAVFVLECDGSMMSSFDAVRVAMRLAIMDLTPSQSFNIIAIADANPPTVAPALLPAINSSKQKADEFMNILSPHAAFDLMPAMRKAIAMRPEVLFLFIDPTDIPDAKAFDDLITANCGKGKTKLVILAFEGRDAENEGFLKALAEKTGGVYRFVTQRDLLSD